MPPSRTIRALLFLAVVAALATVWAADAPPSSVPATWPPLPNQDSATTPQPPTALEVVSGADGRLDLRWRPPASGPAPESYLLEGGLSPGETLGQLPLGPAPETAVTLPEGVYYLRVRTVAGGLVSEASSELRVVNGALAAPSAPADVTALVHGQTLALGWRPTYAGGTPTAIWLLVDGALSGSLPLPWGQSASFGGVPLGSYTLRLVAVNAAGTSEPSSAVTVNVPEACSAVPGPVTDIRSWRSGSTLTIEWAPPSSGGAATDYGVTIGGAFSLHLDTSARRLSGDAPPGHYTVEIAARNACGTSGAPPGVDWSTAVTATAASLETLVHFAPAATAPAYRVFYSTSRSDLETLAAGVATLDVTASPASLPRLDAAAPLYYRVAPAYGVFSGAPGPVALLPAFALTQYVGWFASVTTALFDADGDGCLDMLGARGRCNGTFDRLPGGDMGGMDSQVANAGKARDVRFADFTGDGVIDVITNVYTRADDTTVRGTLFIGHGDGTFVEDPRAAALGLRGYGETILAADFDNDGDLDVFLPHYTHLDDGGRNMLLVNDGTGAFHDVAVSAGVAMNPHLPPEGAQAVDVNDDGWIDILVASQLFINNGDLTFRDEGPLRNLPIWFDEGLQLFDADLDGDLDLVHHDTSITRLHRNTGGRFGEPEVLAGSDDAFGYGLNVCDLNGDGYEDLLVARNYRVSTVARPRVLLNAGGHFIETEALAVPDAYNDVLACADVDGSGLPDVVSRWADYASATAQSVLGGFRVFRQLGQSGPTIRLRVTGAGGQLNQQGRVVRLRPRSQPAKTLTRVVEAGSGYMAQNGYDLTVAAPWAGAYDLEVRFSDRTVTATVMPGDVLTIRADGSVEPGLH